MTKTIRTHLAILFVWLFTPALQAALITYDGADYTADLPLSGRAGGTGWTGGWTGGGRIASPGLEFPGLVTSANRFLFVPNSITFRTLKTTGFEPLLVGGRFGKDGTELWLSFLARRDGNAVPPNDGESVFGLSLFNGGVETVFIGHTTRAEFWGIHVQVGPAATGVTSSTSRIHDGSTALLVVRLTFGVSGTTDRVDLFVNPTPGVVPTQPSASRSGSNFQFDRIRIATAVLGATGSVDEVRLGESYADVVPVVPGLAVKVNENPVPTFTNEQLATTRILVADPEKDLASVQLSASSETPGIVPDSELQIVGFGVERLLQFRAAPGAAGAASILITATSPGGATTSVRYAPNIIAAAPAGLQAYEPFDYSTGIILNRNGGTGFRGPWSTGVPGANVSANTTWLATPLEYPGLLKNGGVAKTAALASGIQGIQRPLQYPIGQPGTVRYVSCAIRADSPLGGANLSGFFGLYFVGSARAQLFMGKPGGGVTTRFVLENAGGLLQIPSPQSVAVNTTYFLVVKFEFAEGFDRVSLYVNPLPGQAEPAFPNAVKANAELETIGAIGLNSTGAWQIDELRVGTTWASVTPSTAPFTLAAVGLLGGEENVTLTHKIETIAPLTEGRVLQFSLVGETFGATIDPLSGQFEWKPGENDGDLTRSFTVRAESNKTPPENSEVTFSVQVAEANIAPTIENIPTQLVEPGQSVSYQVQVHDADLPTQPIFYQLLDAPDGFTVSAAGLLLWTPAPQQLDKLYTVKLQVSDIAGGVAEQSFSVKTKSQPVVSPPPPLTATLGGTGVVLAWPNIADNLVLQSSATLEPVSWKNLGVTPVLANDVFLVVVPFNHDLEFFRLVNPPPAAP